MAKVKAILNKRYKSEDGFQIVIRVSHKDDKRFYDTTYACDEEHWDEVNQLVKGKWLDKEKINAKIKSMKAEVVNYELACQVNKETFDLNKLFKRKETTGSFIDWLKGEMEGYETKKKEEHAQSYEKIIKNLTKWKKEVLYADLLADRVLDKLEGFLRTECKCGANTIQSRFSIMRSAWNRAMRNGGAPSPNPFVGYKVKGEKNKKEKLTKDEIEMLWNAKLTRPNRRLARDLFLFSYYCRGIRFENVIKMKKADIANGVAQFQIVKSNKPGRQEIHPRLKTIIDRHSENDSEYIFPIVPAGMDVSTKKFLSLKRTKGTRINESIESTMKQLGIKKKITMHCARHSFAYHLLLNNVPLKVISQALGHSKVSTTERYLAELDSKEVDNHVDDLYHDLLLAS